MVAMTMTGLRKSETWRWVGEERDFEKNCLDRWVY